MGIQCSHGVGSWFPNKDEEEWEKVRQRVNVILPTYHDRLHANLLSQSCSVSGLDRSGPFTVSLTVRRSIIDQINATQCLPDSPHKAPRESSQFHSPTETRLTFTTVSSPDHPGFPLFWTTAANLRALTPHGDIHPSQVILAYAIFPMRRAPASLLGCGTAPSLRSSISGFGFGDGEI